MGPGKRVTKRATATEVVTVEMLARPVVGRLESAVSAWLAESADLVVEDAVGYAVAGTRLVALKALAKEVTATFQTPKRAMDTAKKALLAEEKRLLDPLTHAAGLIEGAMVAWKVAAEAQRLTDEAAARVEAAREAGAHRDQEAAAMEAAGDLEGAAAMRAAPVMMPPVVLPSATGPVAGLAVVERWTFRLEDEAALPRAYLLPDLAKIGAVVRAAGPDHGIPGVVAVKETSLRGTGR